MTDILAPTALDVSCQYLQTLVWMKGRPAPHPVQYRCSQSAQTGRVRSLLLQRRAPASYKNPQHSSLPCFGIPPTDYTILAHQLHLPEEKNRKHASLTRKRPIIVFLITRHRTLHHASPVSPPVSLTGFSTHPSLPPQIYPCPISSTPYPLPLAPPRTSCPHCWPPQCMVKAISTRQCGTSSTAILPPTNAPTKSGFSACSTPAMNLL